MERFGNTDAMQLLLVVILLLCGYFFLFQAVAKRAASRSSIPLLAIVLLLVYLLVSLPLVLIISQMGGLGFTFLALLILASFIGVFAFFRFVVKHFREINKGMLVLFLLYLLMVSYVTFFSPRPASLLYENGHPAEIRLHRGGPSEAFTGAAAASVGQHCDVRADRDPLSRDLPAAP